MGVRQVPAGRLNWLRREAEAWRADGLIDDATAAAITGRYRAGGRMPFVRLAIALGAAFIGVGLISLVASNLDQLSPVVRFAGIALVWLGTTAIAELVLEPRRVRGRDAVGTVAAVGAARVVAAAAYGATLFQAAQSLQVPAYEPLLVGCWGAGALAYAYACGGVGPLLVGIAATVGWYGWTIGSQAETSATFVVALLVGAAVTTSLAALHESRWRPEFAGPWRQSGALLALVALFIAALPVGGTNGIELPVLAVVGVVFAVALAAGAVVVGDAESRREIAATLLMVATGVLLLRWAPEEAEGDALSGAELVHGLVATAIYVATAVWFAIVGAVRARPYLTNLATAALVLFVTVQSFGVFAPLLSGAALFLVVGVVLIVAGLLADRGRRRLVAEVKV